MKILAFGASTSRSSINKALASYAASLVPNSQVEILDLNDFEIPMYSEDKEAEIGKPQLAKNFLAQIECADALVISFAEHNGTYTVGYKNLFDWASRITQQVFQNKPVIFLSATPGPGGAKSVLSSAIYSAQFFAANVKGSLSVPSFYENFDLKNNQLTNSTLRDELIAVMNNLQANQEQ